MNKCVNVCMFGALYVWDWHSIQGVFAPRMSSVPCLWNHLNRIKCLLLMMILMILMMMIMMMMTMLMMVQNVKYVSHNWTNDLLYNMVCFVMLCLNIVCYSSVGHSVEGVLKSWATCPFLHGPGTDSHPFISYLQIFNVVISTCCSGQNCLNMTSII